jgi:hypothetical protein
MSRISKEKFRIWPPTEKLEYPRARDLKVNRIYTKRLETHQMLKSGLLASLRFCFAFFGVGERNGE